MMANEAMLAEWNEALKAEFTAATQYSVHAGMCQSWGYEHLAVNLRRQASDEMKHVQTIIERILLLKGSPRLDVMPTPRIGVNVKVQFENDLAAELRTLHQYKTAIAVCDEVGDWSSQALFEQIIADEQTHTGFLEAQLFMIGELGYDRYLAQQIVWNRSFARASHA